MYMVVKSKQRLHSLSGNTFTTEFEFSGIRMCVWAYETEPGLLLLTEASPVL